MGARRTARENALMVLYQIDVSGADAAMALERFYDAFATGEDLDPPPPFAPREGEPPPVITPEVREYATALVHGVTRNLEAIDEAIQTVSAHWRLERMARVDRNILRLGAFELMFLGDDVPRKVAINEAIEIAKRYGTHESSAFINGILDRVGAGSPE